MTDPRDAQIADLRAVIEADRTRIIDGVNALDKALNSHFWLTEGRDPYEWDDDRYRQEFGAAARAVLKALEPLRKVGADLTNCPPTTDEVIKARADKDKQIADLKRQVEEARRQAESARGAAATLIAANGELHRNLTTTREQLATVVELLKRGHWEAHVYDSYDRDYCRKWGEFASKELALKAAREVKAESGRTSTEAYATWEFELDGERILDAIANLPAATTAYIEQVKAEARAEASAETLREAIANCERVGPRDHNEEVVSREHLEAMLASVEDGEIYNQAATRGKERE